MLFITSKLNFKFTEVLVLLFLILCLLTSCQKTKKSNDEAPMTSYTQFPAGLTWYIQLLGKVNTSKNVQVYHFDLEDNKSSGLINSLKTKGIRVVCYFSGGTYEEWRSDAKFFPKNIIGKSLPEWAGEKWLDIRSESIKPIMINRIKIAKQAGCDGIDPDNVDAYQNDSGFPLTESDQLKYLIWLADTAHEHQLAIGLKNSLGLITSGALAEKYDFAINESCYDYNECSQLDPFIKSNKAVFIAQYSEKNSEFCKDAIKNNYFLVFFDELLEGKSYIPCKT